MEYISDQAKFYLPPGPHWSVLPKKMKYSYVEIKSSPLKIGAKPCFNLFILAHMQL